MGEISAGSRAHPPYTPMKKYNSICVGSFRRTGQPFVKCGVIRRLFFQRSSAESPSWQFCRQISEFPAFWKVSGHGACSCAGPWPQNGVSVGQVCLVPGSPNTQARGVQGASAQGQGGCSPEWHTPTTPVSQQRTHGAPFQPPRLCLPLG